MAGKTELAEELGIRVSTVQYYSDLGLLPYERKNRNKMYNIEKCRSVLEDISARKSEGQSIMDIYKDYKRDNKLSQVPKEYTFYTKKGEQQ